MSREYRHIEGYEKEILELKRQGKTNREIGDRFGFSLKQVKNFNNRYNRKQKELAAGIVIRRKGRQSKDYAVSGQDKVAELKYALARKDAKIKQLEMENELMRDFLAMMQYSLFYDRKANL